MDTTTFDRCLISTTTPAPAPAHAPAPAPAPARARAGELYARHADDLRTFARKLLRSESDADDVVQDVFLRVLTGRERHDPRRASERTWLRVLVRSEAQARTRRRALEAMASLEAIAEEEDLAE